MPGTTIQRVAWVMPTIGALVLLSCGRPFGPSDYVGSWSGSNAEYLNVRFQVSARGDSGSLTFDVTGSQAHISVTEPIVTTGDSIAISSQFLACAAPYENMNAVAHSAGFSSIRLRINMNDGVCCICPQFNPFISSTVTLHRG